jgi:signal transduction histidine kinase
VNASRGPTGGAQVPVDRTDDTPKPDHSEDPGFEFGDVERRRTIELLTGINSSRKTYYPALKQKVAELELSNVQLDRSRERAERLSEELQRAVTRTSSVLAATRHISRHLGLQEVVRETLDILTGPLSYPWAAIHVFRELGTRELLAEAVSRSSFQVGDHVICLTELEFEPGFIEARESGRVVRMECVAAQQTGLSLVFFPLVSGFSTLGVMSVVAEQTMSADLDVCEGVATSLALAIENAALYRRVVSQARTLDRTLEDLASISQSLTMTTQGEEAFLEQLASTVRELTGARHVAVLVSDADDDLVPVWWTAGSEFGRRDEVGVSPEGAKDVSSMHEVLTSLAQLARAASEPEWVPQELLESLRASDLGRRLGLPRRLVRSLCIPMSRGAKLSGAILVSFTGSHELRPREAETLRILGNQLSVSLENLRLHEEEHRLRHEAEALYGMALTQKRVLEQKHAELQRAYHRIGAIEMQQVVQEERARIAGELHDTVAQVLYSIGLNLDWCMAKTDAGSELRERLASLRRLAGGGIREIRQSIFDLAPPTMERGLLDALRNMAVDDRAHGFVLRVQASQEMPRLGEKEEIEVYRVVQEALVNVRKHALAANVWIHVFATGGDFYVIVEDDGVGMTEEDDSGAGMSEEAGDEVATGFGLANMRRRAAALGGTLTVESRSGEGTRIMLEVPLAGTPRLASASSPRLSP